MSQIFPSAFPRRGTPPSRADVSAFTARRSRVLLRAFRDAGVVRGRTLTWPAIQPDVKNAGGNWVDEDVVVDNGLVTSRKPADIPAFNRKMIEEFAEGVHPRNGRVARAV